MLIFIIISLLLLFWYLRSESFSTKREKATSIVSWFEQNTSPTYNEFKRDMNGQSDILDYTVAKDLYNKKSLNIQNMEPLL